MKIFVIITIIVISMQIFSSSMKFTTFSPSNFPLIKARFLLTDNMKKFPYIVFFSFLQRIFHFHFFLLTEQNVECRKNLKMEKLCLVWWVCILLNFRVLSTEMIFRHYWFYLIFDFPTKNDIFIWIVFPYERFSWYFRYRWNSEGLSGLPLK